MKRSTAMKELRDSSGDTGLFSNITDEEIDEAEKEEAEAPPELDPSMLNVDPEKQDVVPNLDSKTKGVMDKLFKWARR